MARKSTGKRQRFEIFKRDRFQCAYCGRSPPDVLLQVDHILAVANGGGNEETNLITACADCNAGKSDLPLTSISRPLGLNAEEQLERAEQVRAFAEMMLEARQAQDTTVNAVADAWYRPWNTAGTRWGWPASRVPSIRQFLGAMTIAEILECIDATHRAESRGRIQKVSAGIGRNNRQALCDADAFRYFCGCCWKTIRQKQEGK